MPNSQNAHQVTAADSGKWITAHVFAMRSGTDARPELELVQHLFVLDVGCSQHGGYVVAASFFTLGLAELAGPALPAGGNLHRQLCAYGGQTGARWRACLRGDLSSGVLASLGPISGGDPRAYLAPSRGTVFRPIWPPTL